MIFPARAPLEPHGSPLRGLYVSLNSPVVALESFPTAPASAAVALHEAGATLCVRSIRTGHARLFTTTEAVARHRQTALDAALSLAESMGFLFDDDEVARRGDAGPEESAAIWRELCGEGLHPETSDAPAPPADSGVAEPESEILLEEPFDADAEAQLGAEVETDETPEPDGDPERLPLPPLLLLSKFRWAQGGPHATVTGAEGEPVSPSDTRLRLMSRF